MRSGISHKPCRKTPAVPDHPARRQWQIMHHQMRQTALETPPDVHHRNIVPTQPHALTDACHGLIRAGKPQVVHLDNITCRHSLAQQPHIRQTAQCAFKRECLPSSQAFSEFSQQQSRSLDRSRFRLERGQTTRNFIRIEKAQTFHLMGQKGAGEGRFPCAIATADHINHGLFHNRRFRRPPDVSSETG